ncbi:hypothetical protein OAF75_01455 [Verrucomicrobiales bacterium]|nr:hypothetical protein [Verrucomicrobiales bacterium]MDB4737481.1 hypothetical protein [Verrucomicrobiales bacterium]|tara:strand:- start:856 stop:1266 length:411 start_codon:yes stop_codon:yes gene_type:complete
MPIRFKTLVGIILGLSMIRIGFDHLIRPEIFDSIVPDYLGFPRFWTIASGVLEIILGIGIILPVYRQSTARYFTFFLVCVYLANLNMWLNDVPFNGTLLSLKGHIIRLFAQLILICIGLWLAGIIGKKTKKTKSMA